MSGKFPVDAPRRKVVAALTTLGCRIIRDTEHVSMQRVNPDGTCTPLTMPAHRTIKSSTLRMICRQSGIDRDAFLAA